MSDEQQSWPSVLGTLLEGQNLDEAAAGWAMGQIMSGEASDAQIAGFIIALRSKGETIAEVEGLALAAYEHGTGLPVQNPALDLVGTGGDRAHTVNITTMAAITAAAAGARVVKHGNRSASSSCGSADVLEELGIPLDLPVARVAEIVDEAGITFCFAPVFHPALRFAAVPRRELGVPTAFNMLAPLINPGRPSTQAVGVADGRVAGIIAGVLASRGSSALVFRGDDGLDELTTTTTSRVWVVGDGQVVEERFDPTALGIAPVPPEALRGGDAAHNADVVRRYVDGETGPVRETVLLNAAAGLAAYEFSTGSLTDRLAAGYERAAAAVDTGAARDVLDRWVAAASH